MDDYKIYRVGQISLLFGIVILLIVVYASLFVYRGAFNLNYMYMSIMLVNIYSYNILKKKRKSNDKVQKLISPLRISILIFIFIAIISVKYLPKYTYKQGYEKIKEDLLMKFTNVNIVEKRGDFTRDYPYNFFSNKTYIYRIKVDNEEIYYYFNQYTGESYEIQSIEGVLLPKNPEDRRDL